MKIFGIVMENNPFHLGHKYFINQINNKYNPDLIIAITSTSFSMRGDISIISKFDKTNLLLNADVDIVLELPVTLSLQNADRFSSNAIKILNKLQITDIAFGSETNDLSLYHKLYDLLKYNTEILKTDKATSKKKKLQDYLDSSNFSNKEIEQIQSPNFTLGFQYIKTILDNNFDINFHLIERKFNNYHDTTPTCNIASATSIRELHSNNIDVSKYVNYDTKKFIDLNYAYKKLHNITNYVYNVNSKYIKSDFMLKEGIQNYIKNNGNFYSTYKDLIGSLNNKKYTSSTISRSILHNILETTNQSYDYCDYIRILGANKKGFEYINTLDKDNKSLLFSNPNEIKTNENFHKVNLLLNYELSATKLYSLITDNPRLYENEYKLPIRKD